MLTFPFYWSLPLTNRLPVVAHVNFVFCYICLLWFYFFSCVYLRVATQFKLSMKEMNQRTSSGWVLEERKTMIRCVSLPKTLFSFRGTISLSRSFGVQDLLVWLLDKAIHWINCYQVNSTVHFVDSYLLDSNLSAPFIQLGPGS